MENLDVMVLRKLLDWRQASKRALLATVVRTWGSSPRPVGSIMALSEDGSVIGSVSGGCIEDDLIARYSRLYGSRQEMPGGPPNLITYGVSAEEAHRFGLPCGGTLELLLEYNPDAIALANLVEALGRGKLVRRTVSLASGHARLEETRSPDELVIDGQDLTNTFGPEYRMLLIGAGQIAEYLATMAVFTGFSVTLCDPREEHRSQWSVSGVAITTQMPDDAVVAFNPDRRSCVVALSHDPKLDDLALLEAIESEAFYVGAIGSRRNARARKNRMIAHFGQTEESLNRLRGPIGIYIGSKTPPEIAVSVMAEILAVKNVVDLPKETTVAHAKTDATV